MVYPLKPTRFDGQMKARTYNFKYNNMAVVVQRIQK